MEKKESNIIRAIVIIVSIVFLWTLGNIIYDKTIENKELKKIKEDGVSEMLKEIKTTENIIAFNIYALESIKDGLGRDKKKAVLVFCDFCIEVNKEIIIKRPDLDSSLSSNWIDTFEAIKGSVKSLNKKDYYITIDFINKIIDIQKKTLEFMIKTKQSRSIIEEMLV